MMTIMAILGGLIYGIKGGLRATVATFFVGWVVTAIVEKLEKGRATKRKKLEHERRHPYVASPGELPRVLEIKGFRRADPSAVHLCDWQGWALVDRNMPDGKRGFDVIFKKLDEGWKAQTGYLGMTEENLAKTWPEQSHPTPLAAVQAEMSSAWTNCKVMDEFLGCFRSITPVTSAEHENPEAEQK